MIDLEKLARFLVKAKRNTYASEKSVEVTSERPLHKELEYESDGFYYRDSYTGFFQAPGMEEVRLENREGPTLWTMAYSGGMMPSAFIEGNAAHIKFAKLTFRFLKKALSLVKEDAPFRGPETFSEDKWWYYTNSFDGDIKRFTGKERIIFNNCDEVFNQDYIGGLVIRK